MEQKKLLLVILSVGIFLVVLIGAGMWYFAPKGANPAGMQAIAAVNPATAGTAGSNAASAPSATPSTVDANVWARNPASVASIEPSTQGVSNNSGNVIYIYGERPAEGTPTVPTTVQSADGTVVIDIAKPAAPALPTPPAPSAVPANASASAPSAAGPSAAATPRPTAAPVASAATPKPATRTPSPTKAPAVSTAIADQYWVQTGSFSSQGQAEEAQQKLKEKGIPAMIQTSVVKGKTWFRVRVGPYSTKNEADYWLSLVTSIKGFESSMVFFKKGTK